MTIPKYEELLLPLLESIKDGKIHSLKNIEKKLEKDFQLTIKEKEQLKPSGNEKLFSNRLRWARLYLNRAGLLTDPKTSHVQITPEGKDLLEQKLKKVTPKFLKENYPKFKEWHEKNKTQQIKKKTKEIPEKKGIIVLLDALGTKGIWKKHGTERVIRDWSDFTQNFESHLKQIIGNNIPISFSTFSDTILIVIIHNNIDKMLIKTAEALLHPLVDSMILGRPLRGCITTGTFHHDNGITIGRAIDEAAEYYELPQWIGISASPSANMRLNELNQDMAYQVFRFFEQYDIPLEDRIEVKGWALRWPDVSDLAIIDSKKDYDNTEQLIKENLKNLPDLNAVLKWRNTLKFYEYVTSPPHMYSSTNYFM